MTAQLDFSREVLAERYQVQQQLGRKTGRRTLLAHDLETRELVVIKLLLFGADFHWDDLKLFEREADILQALAHSAIPQYLNHFELNTANAKGFALVQTYINARSLEDHLKAGRSFSHAEIKQLATDLLEILDYLHRQTPSVIHRDIKPSNILLGNRSGNCIGQIYLVDFGSVQTLAAREGGTITVVGTYGYMPPEQFGGRSVPASDLYSVGATLIYLATGQHPADLPQTDLRIEFEQASQLPISLSRWLRQMTEPSLNRRFASVSIALQALEEPANELALAIRPRPLGSRVGFNKSANEINVFVPPEHFDLNEGLAVTGASSIICLVMLLLGVPQLALLIATPVMGYVALKAFAHFYVRTRLHIDQQKISLAQEIFGVKVGRCRSGKSQDIRKLVRSCAYYEVEEDLMKLRRINVQKSGITLWVGSKKYELGQFLSDAELDWIAQELSHWLNLPITRQ
ncbi:MAG: serine/threonine protein kinase [Cyanobacteria bacterium CRU_2_1]|nr:serine/threonine protein kinase [Cyanobacteria bacterium CRU_2_1]